MSWAPLTYKQLLESLGSILEEVRLKLVGQQDIPDFPIVRFSADFRPFSGSKALLWAYEYVGGGRTMRFMTYRGYEIEKPNYPFVWGHLTVSMNPSSL